ncbi:hypothetical protein AB1Y20_012917 [Prymnesium parvum]|uniref:BTB domain-containing protein n=1 Tax=Prymnesium parvum TaxID=97485 RepID=A0AB34IL83_PRYPA|mmetsp:Transcript_18374/g.42277  ORF Transcript_18374/g.42277 Transcript_18374/m.42277 type:complete len:538 (-) Transcript_18374:133-1746(-)
MRWQQAQPQGRPRKPCEGHTVSVVGRSLYIMFGKHEDDGGRVSCPPVQRLDTETMVLSHPCHMEPGGSRSAIPDDREGHTATVIGNRIYVFGGTWTDEDEVTSFRNDLHALDVATHTWSRPITRGEPPAEREGHTAVGLQKRIYFFGGTWVDADDNSVYLSDLHVLSSVGDGLPPVEGWPAAGWEWTRPQTTGTTPSPREGHTASIVGETMVVFGGAGLDTDDTSINLSDVHMLDTCTFTWSQPAMHGSIPQERRYHTASVVGDKIYIFGGQYYDPIADLHFECDNVLTELDVHSCTWSQVPTESRPPLRRACHSTGVAGRQIYIVGGRYWDVSEDDYIFLNDIQVLETSPPSTFASDWKRYFNNEAMSDVVLCVQGCRFFAHRVVLAARCEYFRCMFEIGMRETSQAEIEVPDVELEVFRKLLEHLYTDTEEIPQEIALPLFAAADRFGVERLRRLCALRVETIMRVDTVCSIFTVADQHGDECLKVECVRFIVSNFAEVHNTEAFRRLDRPLLDAVHAAISARLFPSPPLASKQQ